MAEQNVQMEEFLKTYPLPANEADRIRTVQRYKLTELPLPVRPVEDVIKQIREQSAFGGALKCMFVSVLDEHSQYIVSMHIKHDEDWDRPATTWHSMLDGMTDGFEWGSMPKKFSACQYVVATGQMQCAINGGE